MWATSTRCSTRIVRGDGVGGVALADLDEADDTATLAFGNAGRTETPIVTDVDFGFA